jgi:small nuclear ribonucleoprotein (snRNP)-like protein
MISLVSLFAQMIFDACDPASIKTDTGCFTNPPNQLNLGTVCLPTHLPANLVLENTVERIHHHMTYADSRISQFTLPPSEGSASADDGSGPRNVCIIRGENVVLLGEIVSFNGLVLLELMLYHILTWRACFGRWGLGFGFGG